MIVRTEKPKLISPTTAASVLPVNDQPATPTLSLPRASKESRRALPHAPRLGPKSLREALAPGLSKEADANSLDALLSRYAAAYDSAHTRLETGLRIMRLNPLFASPRLSASGGVIDTRVSLAGASNVIRVFRAQQAAIEAAYQDSVILLARKNKWPRKKIREWYSRPALQEAPTLKLLSGSLLTTIDSVLGLLDAQAGAYKIRGTAIAFEDPSVGHTYGVLRRRIREQMDAAVAAGGASSGGPTALLLRAIGVTTLPRET
jgi:hypothetical protein